MIKYLFFLLFFLLHFKTFPQETPFKKRLEFKSEQYKTEPSFKSAMAFFLQEKWDSTLVYTSRLLSVKNSKTEIENYGYLLRAYSFQKKRLFQESYKEYAKIPVDFVFYPAAQMFSGEVAIELRKFDEAIVLFKEALLSKDGEDLGLDYASAEQNLGISYFHMKQFDLSEVHLVNSVKAIEKKKDTLRITRSYGNLAMMYYEQYKDDQAIPYFERAYQLSKKVEDFNIKRVAAINMSVVEENRKDFIKALKYRKEYERWKDSLNNQNKIYETAQLEKKIAVEQKEKEVQVLEAENKAKEAQNKVYLFSGILVSILLVIAFVSYRGTVKRNKIITAQKEDLDVLNATKDKLFSIVSHDLRSSVNAIKTSNKKLLGNLETQNKKELTQTLQQNSAIVNGAYGLLDNLLNWALLQTQQTYFEMTDLSLYHLVSHVAFNYQPILQEKDIAYVTSVSKKTQVFADQESLKIILRNLLDNAIKFSKESGKVHIYSEENEEGYVDLIIEDYGMGMDKETQQELLKDTQLLSKKKHEDIIGTGLGLHLVKSMIAKNQGKLNIESELARGTKMIISLRKINTA